MEIVIALVQARRGHIGKKVPHGRMFRKGSRLCRRDHIEALSLLIPLPLRLRHVPDQGAFEDTQAINMATVVHLPCQLPELHLLQSIFHIQLHPLGRLGRVDLHCLIQEDRKVLLRGLHPFTKHLCSESGFQGFHHCRRQGRHRSRRDVPTVGHRRGSQLPKSRVHSLHLDPGQADKSLRLILLELHLWRMLPRVLSKVPQPLGLLLKAFSLVVFVRALKLPAQDGKKAFPGIHFNHSKTSLVQNLD